VKSTSQIALHKKSRGFVQIGFQTAFVGELLDISAFDQPGANGKKFTNGLKTAERATNVSARVQKA
jgi:hypothetical protein